VVVGTAVDEAGSYEARSMSVERRQTRDAAKTSSDVPRLPGRSQ